MDLDSIDEKTAFKLGFATRCFEMGLEPAQVKEAFEKSALLPTFLGGTGTGILSRLAPGLAARLAPIAARTGPWGKWMAGGAAAAGLPAAGFFASGAPLQAIKDMGLLGIGLGGGAGLLGGAALGYGKAKLDEEPVDEDEIKSKELSDTYKAYTARLKSQRAYQQYRKARESA
jgi:hypothetical protein